MRDSFSDHDIKGLAEQIGNGMNLTRAVRLPVVARAGLERRRKHARKFLVGRGKGFSPVRQREVPVGWWGGFES